ncbi:sodium channel protein Nach-like [Schistocerca cancellata]|uniref:sodium channel protein Nach-like n=1 Tax=Schistocerca cancellata TaxID=274614 RepID=UPI0021176981|nr:sodium channel protein Nach-like [Schistocerca cancellata]
MRLQRAAAAAKTYVLHLGRETSVHGVSHLVAPDRHPLEVALWGFSIVVAIAVSVQLTMSSYRRFQEQPTVVSLEKDYQNWQNLFPAVTVCYRDRLDEKAAAEYISRKWAYATDKQNYYMNFLADVVNISLLNLAAFTKYQEDRTLYGIADEMKSIATETHIRYKPSKQFRSLLTDKKFESVFTEFGLCFSLASSIAVALEPINSTKPKKFSEPWKCNSVTDQVCYGHLQFDKLKTQVQIFVHSPYEIAATGTWFHYLEGKRVVSAAFKNFQLVSTPEVLALSVRQRGCYLYDQKRNLPYSVNLCKMTCRANFAMRLCRCVPYFYSTLGIRPICDVRGLACLAPYAKNLEHLTNKNGKPVSCKCVNPCDTVHYTVSKISELAMKSIAGGFSLDGLVFKWSIAPYNKSRYKRETLYTFEDLLVSLGGTAALFLGCSLLSAVELVYLLTLRLIFLRVQTDVSPEKRKRKKRRLKWLENITKEIL